MGGRPKKGRTAIRLYFKQHKTGCIIAAALLLICIVLGLIKPSQTELISKIPEQFKQESGTRYSQSDVNLWVVGVARGRNVKTAQTQTFIGFAGRIIDANIDAALDAELTALRAPLDEIENQYLAKKRNYSARKETYKQTNDPKDKPDPADKPSADDKAKLNEAKAELKALLKTEDNKSKVSQLSRQKTRSTVADIVLWVPPLLDGTVSTVTLTIISVLIGIFFSIFLALGKISKFMPLSKLCGAYIFFFRGTPLLMQLLVVYFGLPMIDKSLAISDPFTAACIAFSMNSAAYCAEIIRAAIQSIDKGQFEASRALGLKYSQTMGLIIIPQSIRRLIPPMANEFIMVLKDASLVTMIGMIDLTQMTFKISNSNATMMVYFPALAIYLIITAFFTFIFNRLEKRFSIHL